MEYTKGIQKIEVFEKDRIIKSSAVGVTNVEEVTWLKDTLIEIAKKNNWESWAYIADISKLEPVAIEVSSVLVKLHNSVYENGCACLAFVESKDTFTSKQASVHQKISTTVMKECHFDSFDEAYSWVKENL
mgnify:FL=1